MLSLVLSLMLSLMLMLSLPSIHLFNPTARSVSDDGVGEYPRLVAQDSSNHAMQRLRVLQPDAAAHLERINEIAPTATDADQLELCAGYIDAFLRGQSWREPESVSARDRSALAFTEQFMMSVGDVTQEQIDAMLAHVTPEEVYGFIAALHVVDMTLRVELVAGAMLR